jgi:hypothetical protein
VKDKTGSLSAPDAAPSPATHHPAGVSHNWRDAAEEWRINWRIGIAAFLAIGLSHGSFQAVSSLFVLPLQAAFGWSRGEVAFAFNASLVTALAAPFVGRAVDRFGTRRIMLGGMTITALLYAGLASMNGSLALFYLLSTLVSVIGLSASGLTCSRVVSQAFVRSRGLSLGRCPQWPGARQCGPAGRAVRNHNASGLACRLSDAGGADPVRFAASRLFLDRGQPFGAPCQPRSHRCDAAGMGRIAAQSARLVSVPGCGSWLRARHRDYEPASTDARQQGLKRGRCRRPDRRRGHSQFRRGHS